MRRSTIRTVCDQSRLWPNRRVHLKALSCWQRTRDCRAVAEATAGTLRQGQCRGCHHLIAWHSGSRLTRNLFGVSTLAIVFISSSPVATALSSRGLDVVFSGSACSTSARPHPAWLAYQPMKNLWILISATAPSKTV